MGIFAAGASPYGCLDMSGNVWEWTLSKFMEYPYVDDDRNKIDQSGKARVLRGGSFLFDRRWVRCAYRFNLNPVAWYDLYGFRLVAPQPSGL